MEDFSFDAGACLVPLSAYPQDNDRGSWKQLAIIMADLIREETPEARKNGKSHFMNPTDTVFATHKKHAQLEVTQKGYPGVIMLIKDLPKYQIFPLGFVLGADMFVRQHAEIDGNPVFACWQREHGLWAMQYVLGEKSAYRYADTLLVADLQPKYAAPGVQC